MTARPKPRAQLTPPHVPIRALRHLAGLTLDGLADLIEDATGVRYTRGTLSAVESGLRGTSKELLAGIEVAYGLEPGTITTTYRPRLASVRGIAG
ncbi:helix-turn-helix domain-containing protein [Mycobacteroides abscessus]|uniref:helix-turn-helix domain-containing protein n=1 Tax=Mycobacteroides abscessus TaxID=36809 RepID=UPI0009280C0A|nr:helix-turn-helix transcriptional regulator [Mycobacteroides abscessus]SIK42041.1 Uncharacterised protein [Mycobacteroides abscessus subsp. abscessus]